MFDLWQSAAGKSTEEDRRRSFANGSQSNEKRVFFQLIDDYFDILIGSKVDSSSYRNIANHIKEAPDNILFLTDSPKGTNSLESKLKIPNRTNLNALFLVFQRQTLLWQLI